MTLNVNSVFGQGSAALEPETLPLGPTISEKERAEAKKEFQIFQDLEARREVISQLFDVIKRNRKENGKYSVHGDLTKKLLVQAVQAGVILDHKKRKYKKAECDTLCTHLRTKLSALDIERQGYLQRLTVAVGKHEKLQREIILPVSDKLAADSKLSEQIRLLEGIFQYVMTDAANDGSLRIGNENMKKQLALIGEAKDSYTPEERQVLIEKILKKFEPLYQRWLAQINQGIPSQLP